MLQAGDTLAGYRIEAVAGVGGMGVVYRATQLSLDRPVALKVLSSTLVGNRTFRERFRREGRHAAALDHPNIIPVYEAGESNGLMFIAMRLVDGPSLADLIDRDELSGREALRILRSIASALDAAHEAGLVHRDIKPQNILLTRLGHPYLADFGITKGSDHGGLTYSGDFVGSLNYVAPEQIEGKEVGGSSDIYALACVLFQSLTGAYPYARDTDAALMHAHLSAPPPTLAERGIDGPARLEAVFACGMAKEPTQRYATASRLLDACGEALADVDPAVLDRAPAFPPPGTQRSAPEAEPSPGTHSDPLVRPAPPAAAPAPADGHRAAIPEAVVSAAAAAPPAPARVAPPAPAHVVPPASARPPAPPQPPARGDVTTTDARLSQELPIPADTDDEDAPRRRRLPAWAPLVALGALALAAPAAGYVLGHRSEPAPQSSRTAAVAITHDATWAPSTGSVEGLRLDGAVSVRRADGLRVTAGRLPAFTPGFDPMPAALGDRLMAEPSAPQPIALGKREALRYGGALPSGDELWVAFAPDSRGWVAIACEGPNAGSDPECPEIAATVAVPDAEPVALGPDAALANRISATLSRLGAAREASRTGLAAKSLPKRRTAARQLASAHTAAARSLAELEPRPQEKSLIATLSLALERQAAALTRLGSAAGKRDESAYRAARRAVAEQEIKTEKALDRLTAAGYGA